MKYLYYATFHKDPESGYYEVEFPDFKPYIATFGEDMARALRHAKNGLELYLIVMEDDLEKIPPASNYETIKYKKGDLLIPIEADTDVARMQDNSKLVKKTVMIPFYLSLVAKERKIDLSRVLTDALKKVLNLS
ncbi:type II toxin-antitoxin system HicB family antitoxin [Xylocopilactobacillus apicola]|uniref:HicB-like antitoxin of toxin-antitoxin system domain-containing protein n=1 Tax=Xylocopilactobacillus apicola TaxID=2932184 RepID=A0AAU9CY44_9LACO|nr:type II toxin-antitoxin system HicB family antitoxin [Xylocopilactobacillus apicola]BDR58957.1 hypothetical protein XA3_13980 [Xylocopilactobacillus apicola]